LLGTYRIYCIKQDLEKAEAPYRDQLTIFVDNYVQSPTTSTVFVLMLNRL